MTVDLTVAAVPAYFASMGAEAWWHGRTKDERSPIAGDYERDDTLASLAMGVGSLFIPLVTRPLLREFDLGRGRYAKAALGVTVAALATTAVADAIVRAPDLEAGARPAAPEEIDLRDPAIGTEQPEAPATPTTVSRPTRRARAKALARRLGGSAALTTVAGAGAVVAGTWASRTLSKRMFARRVLPDWGTGAVPAIAAVLGWDFIYYWNHRLQHEARYMWAIHVVHHSSEHYNLSTALRQPVSDALGTFAPYGILAWLGIRPELIEQARGINLIYQFWIHTEAIRSIGPLEKVLNSPSHHRVHHGSNRQYLDRNHGSILIIWDKLFGTFEPEDEPVTYGLTKNIHTYNAARIITHEYVDMAADVVESDNWADRMGFVVRGPGWASARHEVAGPSDVPPEVSPAVG